MCELHKLYKALGATNASVINMIVEPDDLDCNQSRILGYLKTFIGNLEQRDLQNFLRYVTGSSIMIIKNISILFNAVVGLGRRPIGRACNSLLELSTDFAEEFLFILSSEYAWPMNFC